MTNRKRWLGRMVILSLACSTCVSAGAKEYTTTLTGERVADTEYTDAYVDDHTVQFGVEDTINPADPNVSAIHVRKETSLTIRTDGTLNTGVKWVEDASLPGGGSWKGSGINVDGRLDVKGQLQTMSLFAGAADDAGTINVDSGNFGSIASMNKGAIININMKEDGTPGDNVVVIGQTIPFTEGGGLHVMQGDVNIALTTPQSLFQGGFMCNGVLLHRTSIYLTNGAQWNVDYWEPRNFLTKFKGGKNKDTRGIMNLPDKIMEYGGGQPMKINNYSGYTLINYGRMIVDTPVAGELTIDSAEKGSYLTLRTDRNGLEEDQGQVDAVLEKLANKLIYTGYVTGERHLLGELEIAEGLTAGTSIWKNRSISFDEQGRGHLLSKINLPITGTPADILYAAYADKGFNTYTFPTPIVIDTGDTAAIQAAKPIAITGKLTVYGDIALDHGSVSINRSGEGILPDAPTVLAGDLRGEGSARIGLGKYSAWRGAALQKGALDLAMEEAIWENAAQKAAERGSRVERLQAGENTLIWQKDGKPFTIDRFSGSLLLRYDHEAGTPTVFSAGDTIISKADPKARITLITDNGGINTNDETQVHNVLDNLAQKLIYEKYADGYLTGRVAIGEGLTQRLLLKSIGRIAFTEGSGRGRLDETAGVETVFTSPLTGDLDKDKTYVESRITSDGITYDFKVNSTIDTFFSSEGGSPDPSNMLTPSSIINQGEHDGKHNLTLNLHGHDLKVNHLSRIQIMSQVTSTNIWAMYPGTITINDPGFLDLTCNEDYYYGGPIAAGSRFIPGDHFGVVINNDNTWEHRVRMRGTVYGIHNGSEENYAPGFLVNAGGIKTFSNALIDIKGLVDIEMNGAWCVSSSGGKIRVGGGHIKSQHYTAVDAYGGHVYINVDENGKVGGNPVDITGNLQTYGQWVGSNVPGYIDMALTTPESLFIGRTQTTQGTKHVGDVRLWLQNGATWINRDGGFRYGWVPVYDMNALSRVMELHGGIDEEHRGILEMPYATVKFVDRENKEHTWKGASPLHIHSYSGHILALYERSADDPTEVKGGTITIEKAAANSFITLRTDNDGLNTSSDKAADKNLVSETLNKLANKLFYTAYKDGERNLTGKVEIAEGLTASAAGLRIGDITYKDADGQGQYLYTPETPGSQTIQAYEEGITGNEEKDQVYVNTGVLKNGIYTFGLTPTTITAEKPIAAETDITIQGGSIKMELKNSGENKTAIETGKNTVTVTAGRLDMKEGDAEIKGGTLNAYTDIKGREIKVENGGKLHMAGNLDIDTMSVNGENAKALLLADKEGVPAITAKINTVIVTDKALLNISKGAKAETGLLSVNNASANFNDTVTIGKSLEAENGARVMMRNGGEIKGTVKAENEGTLVSLTGASLKENSTIEAWDKAQINLTRGSTEGNKVKAAGGTVKLRQGSYKLGDIEATNKGTAYIEGENGTTITGRLKSEGKGSTVTAVLKGENSILEGNLEGNGMVNLELKDKARWKGTGTVTGKMKTTLREGSLWTNTGKSDIGWLTSENGNIDMRESQEGYVRITNYKGKTNILYGQDGKGNIKGGDITIRKAEEGSSVNLITDNRGLNTSQTAGTEEKALVTKTLDNMARKLNYIGYQKGERNLEGSVTIAEGLTASSAVMKTGEISYSERGNGRYIEKGEKKETGRTSLGSLGMTRNAIYTLEPAKAEPVTATKTAETAAKTSTAPRMRRTSEIIYGDKETQMMRGSKTAMTAAALLWRGNNNDLERRMGDIRLGKEENGIWARYLGGKNELDKQKTSYKQTYNIAQAGYDKKKGNWTIGMALDYGTGKDTYANGTGKEKLASLSLYGTMQKEDGQYLDIILKGSRIKNDYTVYNEMNHRLDGKYRTSGVSVSMEYGKRMQKENGIYIEPSIELTAGHLSGKDYDAVSDMGGNKKMHIRQDGINSVIGRIGLGIGKETERSNLFAKIALAHEFGGKVKSIFSAENEPTSGTEVDLKDSWVDVEVGGSWLVNRNTYLYGTYTRNFGADVSSKWRIDAGIRFSF